ncbi:hypothetical protein [Frankia sp. Cppng1_Ct_nod]|uniref:hypothetical protein n=1 Tax=Frankia sp. Cppng1_Ct_nod TaxID=2897162 RepID=UPI0010413408|nr:hypothetical protein [Frankia sp. Cppng1_Ct_nod]
MRLKTGTRLRSQVCSTEVIVVRPGSGDIDLTVGGHPVIGSKETPADGLDLKPELAGGTLLGKRYTNEANEIELLITKAGVGTLAIGLTPLVLKEAKPLPSSD